MKKFLSIILVVVMLCPLVTGCNGSKGIKIGKKVEQTNKELTVYESFTYRISDNMISDYKALYPNVKLNIIKQEVFNGTVDTTLTTNKIAAEIMANRGPDLMVIDTSFWTEADVSKMMRTGVFADMSEFVKADKEYNANDYNQKVMDVGKVDDKQYIIPLSYNMPMMLTTEKIIKETGFDVSKCTDYWGFAGEIDRYAQNSKTSSPPIFAGGSGGLYSFYNYAGIDVLDYDKKTITIDTPEFKKAAELYKRLCAKEKIDNEDFHGDQFGFLNSGKSILGLYNNSSFNQFIKSALELYRNEKQPLIFPIRNIDGGINASYDQGVGIRNNSANKQNAYNFAKLLLSKKYQTEGCEYSSYGIPVLNSAIKSSYEEFYSKSWTTTNGTETYMSSPLPKKDFDKYMSYVDDISEVTVTSGADVQFIRNMFPYYSGKKSYEECVKQAQEQLEIYISE